MQINQLKFDRNGLLEFLPQHGICAELGVDKGDYSKQILEKNTLFPCFYAFVFIL